MIGGHSVHLREESGVARDRRLVTIDMLPDDVLVEIFNCRMNVNAWFRYTSLNAWHALVRVCRRWRNVVFASPRRLNLRLLYDGHRPMSKVLGAWPVLPVILTSGAHGHPKSDQRWDNVVAALESERIYEIHMFDMTNSRLERFATAMQKPFPELTRLEVWGDGDVVQVLPDSFLGGSAPRLRTLMLCSIPFPSMPKLLSSAHSLVTLTLRDIRDSGYISPDAMATALTVMTRLESLRLEFRSPRSLPASRPLPPPTRFVLPALTHLVFVGVYHYLEDLLARIDTPLLYDLYIVFFMDLNFDVPQLHRLIVHAEEFRTYGHAVVSIFDRSIQLGLYPKTSAVAHRRRLELRINCRELEWQLSSLAQVCSSSIPLISALEELEIKEHDFHSSHWRDDMENAQWLELLDPFTALKDLYLTDRIGLHVCDALQELSGERATEVLPALRNLFLDGSRSFRRIQEAIRPFITTRQLSVHPLAIYQSRR